MAVEYTLWYAQEVVEKDIRTLAHDVRARIKRVIETKLSTNPEAYSRPLRRGLKGYRKLRVNDYRVVFRIKEDTVKIFIIQHRSIVYKTAAQRL